jgi:hypothetical protein
MSVSHICKFLHNSISSYQFNTVLEQLLIMLRDFLLQHHTISFARDIDGNFSAPGQSATLILLLHRQDQLHQQDCMQTL